MQPVGGVDTVAAIVMPLVTTSRCYSASLILGCSGMAARHSWPGAQAVGEREIDVGEFEALARPSCCERSTPEEAARGTCSLPSQSAGDLSVSHSIRFTGAYVIVICTVCGWMRRRTANSSVLVQSLNECCWCVLLCVSVQIHT